MRSGVRIHAGAMQGSSRGNMLGTSVIVAGLFGHDWIGEGANNVQPEIDYGATGFQRFFDARVGNGAGFGEALRREAASGARGAVYSRTPRRRGLFSGWQVRRAAFEIGRGETREAGE